MDKFNKICKDIKTLKIQGAEKVAMAAINALSVKHDSNSVKKLISLRPTEPCLRNALKFALSFKDINQGIKKTLGHFDYTKKKITEIGSKLIEDGMIIYTHCHSNTVANILIEAKKQGKKFEVHATETRPMFQGRKTATQLAKAKIPVTFYVDSAARFAIKKADLMLIGADAITTTKVYNKIGSEMFATIAKQFDVPVYICSDSWKFDDKETYGNEEKIEQRSTKEIWPNPPKGIRILNPAFEKISLDLITGIISELGILKDNFVDEVEKNYPWIFR
jgi:ribose 1,5-bisphosphate isomerase